MRPAHAPQRGRPRQIRILEHRQHGGQPGGQCLAAILEQALDDDAPRRGLELTHPRDVGQLPPAELSRDARPHLAGVAILCLATTDHQIDRRGVAHGARQRVGRGPRVGAGKGGATEQHGIVAAHGDRILQLAPCRRGAHGHGCDRATMPFTQAQGLFDGEKVKGVDDGGHAGPHHGLGLGVKADVHGVGHRLAHDNDMHRLHPAGLRRVYHSAKRPPMPARCLPEVPQSAARSIDKSRPSPHNGPVQQQATERKHHAT